MKKIIKLFEKGNVQVCGLKGRGKDMLFANVIARRKRPYVSNIYYGYDFIPYRYELYAVKNNYRNFIENNLNPYKYPLPDKIDLYLSDCGIYFPSQYCNELNKHYPDLPVYMGLSRHLGQSNVHCNSQFIGRVWDKIREQGDTYINCQFCKVFFGKIVLQKIRIYERYDACANNIPPLRVKLPFNPKERRLYELEKQKYTNANGKIKTIWLLYWNKGKYDTRAFKYKLDYQGGVNFEK